MSLTLKIQKEGDFIGILLKESKIWELSLEMGRSSKHPLRARKLEVRTNLAAGTSWSGLQPWVNVLQLFFFQSLYIACSIFKVLGESWLAVLALWQPMAGRIWSVGFQSGSQASGFPILSRLPIKGRVIPLRGWEYVRKGNIVLCDHKTIYGSCRGSILEDRSLISKVVHMIPLWKHLPPCPQLLELLPSL